MPPIWRPPSVMQTSMGRRRMGGWPTIEIAELSQAAAETVVAFEEGHLGLKTWLLRRRCPHGERQPWTVGEAYA
jgi:hypothetical protein